jgi:tetratricopeptide (TPR) repeat protein
MTRPGNVRRGLTAGLLSLAVVGCGPGPESVPLPPAVDVPEGVDEQVAELIADVLEAARANPENAERRAELGMAYEVNGMVEAATECYEQARRLDPAEPRFSYYLAIGRTSLGDPEGALVELERAIELAPDYAPAYLYRGTWLLDLGRTDEAADAFRRATELQSDNPAGWIGMARVYLERQEADEAVAILERWVQIDPRPYLYQLLGQAYRQQGDLDRARQILAHVEPGARPPQWPDPWAQLKGKYQTGIPFDMDRAETLLAAERYVEAIEMFESLRTRGTSGVAVFANLTLAYNRTGDMDKVLATLRAGVEMHPDFYPFRLMISAAYHSSGDLQSALEHLDRAIAIDGEAAEPHSRRAAILLERRQRREALDAFDAALERGADDSRLAFSAAALELEFGSWEKAAERAELAVRLDPGLAPGWMVLGMARAELGHLSGAREALDRAAELQPSSPLLQQARMRLAQLERRR